MHKVYVPLFFFLSIPAPETKAVSRFLIPAIFIFGVHPTPHFLLFSFATLVSVSQATFFDFVLKGATPLWDPDSEEECIS